MKKILFPTDFSKAANHAFLYALHLADRFNAEIITLHVYPFALTTLGEYYTTVLENYDIQDLNEFENYKSHVPKWHRIAEEHHYGHVPISHVLESGDTVETILEVAQSNQVDCIVMGTNGAHGITEIFFGSVTEKVMNRAHCMVMAVPSSNRHGHISRILFLTEFEEQHKTALRQLIGFAKTVEAHIDVLQVKLAFGHADEEKLLAWKAEFHSGNITFSVLNNAGTEKAIMDYMKLHHISMVAMTVKHKGLLERLFLQSMASKMAFHSEIPVLALKYENPDL
ncbi:UspA domain-containing protein [Flavobacterium longum]|uniref:universal stress protein n=1 Tax=Flavobacterium longum TaxID=1299340 RepID=UPI0039E89071